MKLTFTIFLCTYFSLIGTLSFAEMSKESLLSKYKKYPYDHAPLKKFHKEWKEYQGRYAAIKGTEIQLTIAERKANIKLLEHIHKNEPNWIEGYWLIASEQFQLASSYTNEKDLPIARESLVIGREKTRACLKLQPNNPLCKFFLASSLGKIGTIDGVFSSLKGAKEVHDLWMEAMNSPYNHFFTDRISMQGSVRYAFGIFFRLVPDWTILEWFFGIKGDLDKSIKYIKEAIIVDGPFACSRLMLAASLFCRADSDKESEDFKEAMKQLDMIKSMKNLSVQSATCKVDAIEMRKKPSNGCGYSTAKQQEEPDQKKVK